MHIDTKEKPITEIIISQTDINFELIAIITKMIIILGNFLKKALVLLPLNLEKIKSSYFFIIKSLP